jgi:hypothetical protein
MAKMQQYLLVIAQVRVLHVCCMCVAAVLARHRAGACKGVWQILNKIQNSAGACKGVWQILKKIHKI